MLDQVEGTVASLLLPSQDHQCYILRVMTPSNTLIGRDPRGTIGERSAEASPQYAILKRKGVVPVWPFRTR